MWGSRLQFEQAADERLFDLFWQATDPERLAQGHRMGQRQPHDRVGKRREPSFDQHVQGVRVGVDYG